MDHIGLLAVGAVIATACTRADAAEESPTDIAIAELRAETRDLQREPATLAREVDAPADWAELCLCGLDVTALTAPAPA
jgi:hypothetical protein